MFPYPLLVHNTCIASLIVINNRKPSPTEYCKGQAVFIKAVVWFLCVVKYSNRLPPSIVMSPPLLVFKERLDHNWDRIFPKIHVLSPFAEMFLCLNCNTKLFLPPLSQLTLALGVFMVFASPQDPSYYKQNKKYKLKQNQSALANGKIIVHFHHLVPIFH